MTLRVIEGFDFMPSGLSDSERNRLWGAKHFYMSAGVGGTVPDIDLGRFDFGNAWKSHFGNVAIGGNVRHIRPIGSYETEGIIGIAVWRSSAATNTAVYVSFYNGISLEDQLTVCCFLNGVIQVRKGGPTGTIIQTSVTGVFYYDTWWYLEVKAGIASVGGYAQVRVNTEIVIDIPDADTQGGTATNFDCIAWGVQHYNANTVAGFLLDDLYMCDLHGTENNDYLGNVRVKTQFVTGNGSHLDFSIGGSSPAATNWQSVLNRNLDETKYVYTPDVGDYDLYTIEAILNSPVVYGVQLCTASRQDDATQRILHNQLKTLGGTLDEGVNHYLNQLYTYNTDIWELNPETGAGWTGTEVNGLQIGPKVAG